MTPIPSEWQSQFTPRDLLRDPPPTWPPPSQSTADRVEGERNQLQAALARLGIDLQRRAGS
jgi:hypothetical protein